MITYVAPPSMGLGDLLVTLPVVQSLINQNRHVCLVLRDRRHQALAERIVGIVGTVLDWELADRISPFDQIIDLRDHELQRAGWWGSPEFAQLYPGLGINQILEKICSDAQIPVDMELLPRLTCTPKIHLSDRVGFIPGSAVSSKCWGTQNWLSLAERIGCANVVVIGQRDKSAAVAALLDGGLAWQQTQTLAEAVDVVSSLAAVVSVDTGLMHLSVNQGIATVGIFKRNSVYVRPSPQFAPVFAPRQCARECSALERTFADLHRNTAGPDFCAVDWDCVGADNSRCMETVPLAQVHQALSTVAPELVVSGATTICDRRRQRTGIVL